MAAIEPGKIRNVAVVGHRGTGKTSLVEALLFQTDEINRLGAIDAGTTVSDWDEDEQKRRMSISLTLAHTTWQDRKINLLDVPGDPSFQGEARCALRVVEGALVVVNGVMGLEVGTARVKHMADELGLARVLFVNMLDRERADFFRTLAQIQEQFSSRCVAVHLPIGAEHEISGIVDVLHMCAYTVPDGGKEGEPTAIPAEMLDLAQEYREKLLDEVVQTDEALMEQYLGGEELDSTRGRLGAEARDHARRGVPRRLRRRHQEPRHPRAARPDRRGRAVARPRRARRSRSRAPTRRPSSSRRSPTRSPGGSTSSASSRVPSPPTRRSSTRAATRRSGWGRCCSSRARATRA